MTLFPGFKGGVELLDYEWENPPVMMISGEEPETAMASDHFPRQIVDHYAASQTTFFHPENSLISSQNALFFHHNSLQQAAQSHIHSLYDHPTDLAASDLTPHSLLSFDPVAGPDAAAGFLLVPKGEDVSGPPPAMEFASRIGLNLGWRTYFSSEEDDFINRLYRRSGSAESGLANSPKCQAEGCDADLSHSKHYHRRHKVCEFHSKASTVIAAGLTQRFCQQCSRFHLLAEFDNGKRSCRKRLADHNRRRRKTHQSNQASQKSQPQIPSSSDNLTRSPAYSGAQSSSSVTVATSPTRRMPFHSFTPRSYPAITSSSASSSSIFFSNG